MKRLPFLLWLGGVGFTFVIALLGYALAMLPGLDRIGPLAGAIIIAVVYRQVWNYPERLRPGIEFSSKKLLRLAIILYGLKLNIDVIFNQGLPLLIRDVGTVFAIAYTVLRPYLPLSAAEYGIWSGVSLHEIAHVALAAAPAGEDALAVALLAKLGRVFLLIPLCFILVYWVERKAAANETGQTNENRQAKIDFPWFLLGFMAMSLFGSYVLGKYISVSPALLSGISEGTTFVLTMAMVGLGLNVSFRALRKKALRPLIALTITSALLSLATLLIV